MSRELPRSAAGRGGPWVMTWVVSLATFMEVLDVSIANVALANISGSLGISYQQGTWMVTTYLVANAVIIPISGFLSRVLGRKRYFMISVALFTLSSLGCAFAPSLAVLLFARICQGIGGGGLAPVEQSMVADSFPDDKRSLAFAAFGMVVIVGPVFGPTIGGWVTDAVSWHWIFLINVPVGIAALLLTSAFVEEPQVLRDETRAALAGGLEIDWVGFLLMAVGVGALLVMLDRGQQEDWFQSPLILGLAAAAMLGLGGMAVWESGHPDPIVPLAMLRSRNFAICTVLIMLVGLLVFGTIQLVPQMLQQVFRYSAYDAGLALSLGGLFTIVMMPLSGLLAGRLDIRLLLLPAFAIQALSFWLLSRFSVESTFWDAVQARFVISIGLPFLFIPINSAAYIGLPAGSSDRASAMLNFFRNLGGAFGISLCQTLLARREQFHQDRLAEGLNGLNPVFASAVDAGMSAVGDRSRVLAVIYQEMQRQAAMLSYDEVFHILGMAVLGVLPLVLLLRVSRGNAGARSG